MTDKELKKKKRCSFKYYQKVCPVCNKDYRTESSKQVCCSRDCSGDLRTAVDVTICSVCDTCGKCSWSTKFEPVAGWTAKPTKIVNNLGKDKQSLTDSFQVLYCPKFEGRGSLSMSTLLEIITKKHKEYFE